MNCSYNGTTTATASSENIFANWEFWVDIVIETLVIYITLCQIVVFISKRLYKIHLHKITDVLLTSNLQSVMSFFFIVLGLLDVTAIAMTILNLFADIAAVKKAAVILSGFSFISVYLILWLRQTTFHYESSLRHLSSKPLRVFSHFQGYFVILGGGIMGIVIGYEGIHKNVTMLKCLPGWIFGLVLVLQIEVQIALLMLFLIPMIRHTIIMNNSVSNQKPPEELIKLMKRSVISTVAAVISDVTTFVVFFISGSASAYISNIVFNLICVLFCFNDWKDRFFPWITLCKSNQRDRRNTGQSSANGDKTSGRVTEQTV